MTRSSREPTSKEAKRERRMERQRREAAARRRATRRRRLRNVIVVAVLGAVVGAGIFVLVRPDPEVEGVIRPPNRGRGHVADARYDSPTPTSGPHSASAPRCGTASQGLPLELAVHALEHGAVVVWHDPTLDQGARADALEILASWDSHWIFSPNPGITEPLVATAWNRLEAFEEPGEGLREFVDTYRRRGPERVDCPV